MSNTISKYNEDEDNHIFWEQTPYFKRFNNILTPLAAINIVNKLSLHCKDNEELLEEVELLKDFIKNRQV